MENTSAVHVLNKSIQDTRYDNEDIANILKYSHDLLQRQQDAVAQAMERSRLTRNRLENMNVELSHVEELCMSNVTPAEINRLKRKLSDLQATIETTNHKRDVAIYSLAYYMANGDIMKNKRDTVFWNNTDKRHEVVAARAYQRALELMTHVEQHKR